MKLDQFFTNPDIVDQCVSTINWADYDVVIEPSAGAGAFYHKIVGEKIGLDLEPKTDGVIQQDFFTFHKYSRFNREQILVIGNPPFGKNSSLAIKFFNHAASFADTIAFVLPRTFRKASVINKLSVRFNLIVENILPTNSFHLPDGTIYDVPCVWQVWGYGAQRPTIEIVTTHPDFEFVENDPDFVVQRVGANAGWTHKDLTKSRSSHYLIRASDDVYQRMKAINWEDSSKYDTAGNPSISKAELIEKYAHMSQIDTKESHLRHNFSLCFQ